MNIESISTIMLSAHWLLIIVLSVHIIMRRPPVGVSVAWIAVIYSVPFAGAAFYLLFGEKRLGWRRIKRKNSRMAEIAAWQKTLKINQFPGEMEAEPSCLPIFHIAENVFGFPAQAGHSVELLSDFQTIFDRLTSDIDEAQNSVHLSFYIWQEGGRVTDVVEALIRAARRGVQCRVLADAVGSRLFMKSPLVRRLRKEGIEITAILPTGLLRLLVARTDLRNHRKFLIIDNRISYAGSQNLVDPRYFKHSIDVGDWVDAMARITGPASAALETVFRLDWSVETGEELLTPPVSFAADPATPAGSIIQIAPSGPDLKPEAIHQLILSAIYTARQELVMTTPYFVPDEAMLTALITAALRGVEVTLIVPAHNDSVLVRYASTAHFNDLMSAGVHIALFNGGLLHTKSLSIDGKMCVFGSVNLDMRSIWLNFEISLLICDPDFTGRLRLLQESYLRDSQQLDPAAWKNRPTWRKFTENTCRLLSPLL